MAAGFKTRFFTYLAWILNFSIYNRFPFATSPSFYVTSVVLFLGLFLPWDMCLAAQKGAWGVVRGRVYSIATIYMAAFIFFTLGITAVFNLMNPAWNNGLGLFNFLRHRIFWTDYTHLLLDTPFFVKAACIIGLLAEAGVPILMLFSPKSEKIRLASAIFLAMDFLPVGIFANFGVITVLIATLSILLVPEATWLRLFEVARIRFKVISDSGSNGTSRAEFVLVPILAIFLLSQASTFSVYALREPPGRGVRLTDFRKHVPDYVTKSYFGTLIFQEFPFFRGPYLI